MLSSNVKSDSVQDAYDTLTAAQQDAYRVVVELLNDLGVSPMTDAEHLAALDAAKRLA